MILYINYQETKYLSLKNNFALIIVKVTYIVVSPNMMSK